MSKFINEEQTTKKKKDKRKKDNQILNGSMWPTGNFVQLAAHVGPSQILVDRY